MTASHTTPAIQTTDRIPPLEKLAVGADLKITLLDWDQVADAIEPLDPDPWAAGVKHLLKVIQTQWMLRLRSINEQFARKPEDYDPWPSRQKTAGPFSLMLWPSPDSTEDNPKVHLIIPIWRLKKHQEAVSQGIETGANIRKAYALEITETAANMRLKSSDHLTRLAHRISAAVSYHELQPPGPDTSLRLRQDWQTIEKELKRAYANLLKTRDAAPPDTQGQNQ